MSISITWGLIARMDGIFSAEPLMYCVRTSMRPQIYLVSWQILYGTLNTGGAWLDTWHSYVS